MRWRRSKGDKPPTKRRKRAYRRIRLRTQTPPPTRAARGKLLNLGNPAHLVGVRMTVKRAIFPLKSPRHLNLTQPKALRNQKKR